MTLARRTPLLAAALACGLVAAPAASAAQRVTFDVRPAVPRLASPVTVTIAAPKLKPGTVYKAVIDRTTPWRTVCVPFTDPVTMRPLPGGRFTATLRPKPDPALDMPPAKAWCPGPATLRVERYGPGDLQTTGLAKRTIRFTRRAREAQPPPIPAHEVSISVLPGSTLTAWVPGRPDRSTPVTGSLLGRFRNSDPDPRMLTTTQIAGTLSLPSLEPDPLCPGSAPPASVEVDSSSGMVDRGGTGSFLTLVLRATPLQLFGCDLPGGPAGTTTLTSVSAPVTQMNRMPMIGVVGDVALPGGSQGGITANLLVNWDYTKRWRP